jgi:four helix bundle protein
MATSRHRDFLAYRLAASFADDVRDCARTWPKIDQWTIGIQLIRSAGSIGANIAEALGRGTVADGRRLLLVARGSLLETEHWIDRAESAGLTVPGDAPERLEKLARLLHGLIRSENLHA